MCPGFGAYSSHTATMLMLHRLPHPVRRALRWLSALPHWKGAYRSTSRLCARLSRSFLMQFLRAMVLSAQALQLM